MKNVVVAVIVAIVVVVVVVVAITGMLSRVEPSHPILFK